METNKNQDRNPPSPNLIVKPTQITLVDGDQRLMQPLYKALEQQGYQPRLFHHADEALFYLSKTEILILDASVAQQPKSSKFIKVPTILVLSNRDSDQLPPWLQADHIFLVRQPKNPQALIERLVTYLPPHTSDFDIDPNNSAHLSQLFGINQFLSGHLDLVDLFERILALTPYLNAQFCALLVQEEEEIIYYRSTQPGREELTGAAGRRFAQRLLTDGVEGWTLRHNEAVVLANTHHDSRWFRAPYLPNEEHCVVAIPINLERVEARGVYLLGHKTPGHFSQQDTPILKAAATQIAMAIENAMLFRNQSRRSIQLSLINEVSQAATSILNLDVMLRTVVQAIQRSFTCHSVSIHLYRQELNVVELRAKTMSSRPGAASERDQAIAARHKLGQGLIGWAMAMNQTVLSNDVSKDPRFIFNEHNREVRAALCVPIRLGTKAIGVLDLQSVHLEAFDKYHVAALETLADQLAIAIENARLYDEINQRVQELKSLNEIGQAITSTLDLQETLTLITDQTTRLMDVAAASVVLRDDEKGEILFAAASGEGAAETIGWRMPLNKGIAGWVASQGEPVMAPDVYADKRFSASIDQHSGFTTTSILCVPLQTKGATIGALEVMNKRNGTFNREDLRMLQALAAPAATAIENAQLYEKQNKTIKSLAETQYQLVQSAKLAAVGELAAGVAHEINNPLTTIIGLTSLLQETLPPVLPNEPEITEDLQMIYTEARRARNIVRNLLDFARAEPPKLQSSDFNQLVEEAIFLVYTKSVSQKIRLVKSLSNLPIMQLDTNQIKQVIVNLLNNAVQVMLNDTAEGHPTLTVETDLTLSYNQRDGAEEKHVICKIGDTGHGIKPEHVSKIFDPFFTTKEVGQGTGLGLSISYGIVEKHGGAIDVTSTPGQGTIFTVMLPISPPATRGVLEDPVDRAILRQA